MRTAGLAGVLSVLIVVTGACKGGGSAAPPTVVTSTTFPGTAPTLPDLKFGSPEEAVRHVILQWQAGDREAAAQAATPDAVAALFAKPSKEVQFRSCSQPNSLGVDCIYRYNDGLLRLHLTSTAGDWTVTVISYEGV